MTYDPAKYPVGSKVRIMNHAELVWFFHNWNLNNKFKPEQLAHAGEIATVKRSYMYHGGDILYELNGVPGVWHEQCIESE
jgi:hypothetical protein